MLSIKLKFQLIGMNEYSGTHYKGHLTTTVYCIMLNDTSTKDISIKRTSLLVPINGVRIERFHCIIIMY